MFHIYHIDYYCTPHFRETGARNLNSYPKQFLSDQCLISYKEPIEVPRVHLTSYRIDLFYWQRLPLVDKDWIGSPNRMNTYHLPFLAHSTVSD